MKHLIITIAFVSFCQITHAQLSIEYKGGYGFAAQKELIGFDWTHTLADTFNSYDGIYSSFGRGFSNGINIGYSLNKYLSAEVYTSYFGGLRHKSAYYLTKDGSTTRWETITWKTRMLQVNPAISAGIELGKMRYYSRFGLVIGMLGYLSSTTKEFLTNGEEVQSEKWIFDRGLAWGYSSSAGVSYAIGGHYSLSAEINYIGLKWAHKKGRLTERKVNGVTDFSGLTQNDVSIDYVKEYEQDSRDHSNEPKKELLLYRPYSSLGILIGIRYTF